MRRQTLFLATFVVSTILSNCRSLPQPDEGSATLSLSRSRPCPTNPVDCSPPLPDFGRRRPFRHLQSRALALSGMHLHRSRDAIAMEGQAVWAIAKFSYGIFDADLKDEDIDVYFSAGCDQAWENLGTFRTSADDQHPPVDGIQDTGGRIYLNVTQVLQRQLPPGRYRILFVVPADATTTMANIEIIPKVAAIVVTDVDGTLTASEFAAATSIVGTQPEAHPGAAALMRRFYQRGYTIHYLTARPEWLGASSRDWLQLKDFPPGVLTTTPYKSGAIGDRAMQFKIDEINLVKEKTKLVPSFAFGNKPSDVQAFAEVGIPPDRSYYFKLGGDLAGGHSHSDYTRLLELADQAPRHCQP